MVLKLKILKIRSKKKLLRKKWKVIFSLVLESILDIKEPVKVEMEPTNLGGGMFGEESSDEDDEESSEDSDD